MKTKKILSSLLLSSSLTALAAHVFTWTVDEVLACAMGRAENLNMKQLESEEGRSCIGESIRRINAEDVDFQVELTGGAYDFKNNADTAVMIARYCGNKSSNQ